VSCKEENGVVISEVHWTSWSLGEEGIGLFGWKNMTEWLKW